MSYVPRKRKGRTYSNSHPSHAFPNDEHEHPAIDYSLFIQAHEADLVRGPQAHAAARSLEVERQEGRVVWVGDGLIKWETAGRNEDNAESTSSQEGVWVDRYDHS